jgi:phosphoglycolate phosphatase
MAAMQIWFGDTRFECEAIAFDKDGTLVDRMALWRGLHEARLPILEARLDEATFQLWKSFCGVDPGSGEINLGGLLATGSRAEEVNALAVAIYRETGTPWPEAVSQARRLLAAADEQLPERAYATPLEGVPVALLELAAAGLPLAIITSDQAARALRSAELLGFDQTITCIVTPEHVPQGKPSPEMVYQAARYLGVEADHMAVVGDSIVDLQMARAAGAIPVAVLNQQTNPDMTALAAATIQSVSEIRLDRE